MSNLLTSFFMFLILTNLGLCVITVVLIYLRVRVLEKQAEELAETAKNYMKRRRRHERN